LWDFVEMNRQEPALILDEGSANLYYSLIDLTVQSAGERQVK